MAEEAIAGFLFGKTIEFTLGGAIGNATSDTAKNKWVKVREYLRDYKPDANHEIEEAVLRSYLLATLQTCIIHGEPLGISVKECLIDRLLPMIAAGIEVKARELGNSQITPENTKLLTEIKYRQYLKSVKEIVENLLTKVEKVFDNTPNYMRLNEPQGFSRISEKEWLQKVIDEYTELLDLLNKKKIDFPDEKINKELNQVLREKSHLMQPDSRSEREANIRKSILERIEVELTIKFGELPKDYRHFFIDNWYNYFCGSFQYQLTQNPDLSTKFVPKLLAALDYKTEQIIDSLQKLSGEVNEKYEDIKTELTNQQKQGFEEIKNLLFSFLPLITTFDNKNVRVGIVKEIDYELSELYNIKYEIIGAINAKGEDVKNHTSTVIEKENKEQTKEILEGFEIIRKKELTYDTRQKFELYSPALKSCKELSSPKNEEKWKLVQTLPSGLNLENKIKNVQVEEDFKDNFRWLQYNYDVCKDKYALFTEKFKTHSISWRPENKYFEVTSPYTQLMTTGQVNLTKLWDIHDGELISDIPFVEKSDSGKWGTICWSPDKTFVISGGKIFRGNSGVMLNPQPFTLFSSYLNLDYQKLRRIGDNGHIDWHYVGILNNASHLSDNNNFSPWRPGSEQIITKRDEKNLKLTNGKTGEVEVEIDCGVPSKIRDFAWHPSGEFIAVSFEEHKIRIIEIDTAKIVGGLSVQIIVGWSDDGKSFIAKSEEEDSKFILWDALELKERPMSEEIKEELWFKRFFKNISADGLRHIKIEDDGTKDFRGEAVLKGNIYSVESDKLLFSLPKKVTCAAWSPIDGGLLATCGGSETHIWRLDEKSIS